MVAKFPADHPMKINTRNCLIHLMNVSCYSTFRNATTKTVVVYGEDDGVASLVVLTDEPILISQSVPWGSDSTNKLDGIIIILGAKHGTPDF